MNLSQTELKRRAAQREASLVSDEERRLAYTIPQLVQNSGAGRSKIYEAIKLRELKIRKLGKRTLVLHADAVAWLQSLPSA